MAKKKKNSRFCSKLSNLTKEERKELDKIGKRIDKINKKYDFNEWLRKT